MKSFTSPATPAHEAFARRSDMRVEYALTEPVTEPVGVPVTTRRDIFPDFA